MSRDRVPPAATAHRSEHDSMGEVQVPASALWGAQTQRAVQNFPISGLTMPRAFIRALGLVKWAAADANAALGLLGDAPAHADSEALRWRSPPASTTRTSRSTSSRPAPAPAAT
jgi:hypothetical protein